MPASRGRRSSDTTPSDGRRPLAAIVLSAGEGRRLKSGRAKVLHEVAGRALVEYVVDSAIKAKASPVVAIVGFEADRVETLIRERFPSTKTRFALQKERLGTADAVARARPALDAATRSRGDVLILCGDVPSIPPAALRALVRKHRKTGASLTILTTRVPDPSGYGRMIRDASGRIESIVEEKDASREQRRIDEINSGVYCARWKDLDAALRKIRPNNRQKEYYLTDAVRILLASGKRVEAVEHAEHRDLLGVNSRRDLSAAWSRLNEQSLRRLMAAGVTVVDPGSTWVASGVRVGRDSILHPGVTLEGNTKLGTGCIVRPGCRLADVVAGAGTEFLDHTVAEDVKIGDACRIGPFAHLRPGTDLARDCKIGNFVETKKTTFGVGSKASHLAYLGDADIGNSVNVGAGTITCNYDGVSKHPTRLDDGVFIGSDTQLVAPVSVGKDAYVAAGSTVTKDVPPGALAICRGEQRNLEGWVERRKKRSKRRGGK